MWFIASFLIAVSAAYAYEWFEPISEEAAIICVGVALVSIILTLISAPWPIQLALALGLLAARLAQRKGLLS